MSTRLLKSGFKGEKMVVVPHQLLKQFHTHELIKGLFLTDIGFFPKASNHFRERPNGCSEYILIYCIDGQGRIITKDKTHKVTPNSFFIIEKEQKHTYFSDGRDPWSIYWIHFKGNHAPYLYGKFLNQNNGKPIFIPFNQNKIAEFEYILELLKLGYTDQI
ncbi:MAG: AraC family ligand binding domain-containing protein, partial [Bacteroidota bacterium]